MAHRETQGEDSRHKIFLVTFLVLWRDSISRHLLKEIIWLRVHDSKCGRVHDNHGGEHSSKKADMSLVHSCSVRKTIIHLGIHMVETNGYNNWNCCPLTYLEEFPFSILWTFLWVSLYFYSLITWQMQWIAKSLVLSLLKSLVSWLPLHLQLTLSGYYHPLSEHYSCLLTALLIVRCFLPQCVSIQLPESNFPTWLLD